MSVIEHDRVHTPTQAPRPASPAPASARSAWRPADADARTAPGAGAAAPATFEVLTFRLGGEEYALDILTVQEIRAYEEPLHLPNMPHAVRGVMNLRGVIVPILDLRRSFGLAQDTLDALTATIVLKLAGKEVGVVVDSVNDVTEFSAGHLQPPPAMGASADTRHVKGIATLGEGETRRTLILMDAEQALSVAGLV